VLVGVVANLEDPQAGFVEERLGDLGARFARRWRSEPAALSDLEHELDLLVLLGSDWSVYDPVHAGPVLAEQLLVRRATARGCPVLGICFGGQLVASSLGLVVDRAPVGEVGWTPIESDDAALTGVGPWFQFHGDRWIDTPAAPSLARTAAAPQALLHRRTLALQFHPEVTPETAQRWIAEAPEAVVATGGDPDALVAETWRLAPDARVRCHGLVDAFLDRVTAPLTGDRGGPGAPGGTGAIPAGE
jgi:GMP synthase-like glutamine amidotransferase